MQRLLGEATLVQYAACPSLTGRVQFDSDYSDGETPHPHIFLFRYVIPSLLELEFEDTTNVGCDTGRLSGGGILILVPISVLVF